MDENCKKTNLKTIDPNRRVIGLDAHPDSFTAALLRGQTPAQAVTEKVFNKIGMKQLSDWALKYTTPQDIFALEASGNSFRIVRTLATINRQALVLESCQLGKLKEAHANNDKISAVRIGKAYLAGTAKEVWVPDLKTQARRDIFHTHRKAVKRTSQLRSRISSYLSDNGVRLEHAVDVLDSEKVLQSAAWSPCQKQILEGSLLELRHAQEQRQHWESLIAQEVLVDPELLSLTRLLGIRDLIAFSLGAIIGDIDRFAGPKQLVKYVGLHPAFDDSGEGQWHGGIGGHGRKDLRCLLIEGAQAILRSDQATGQWGRRLMARKGSTNLAVAAVARKLLVAVWYLLKGRWTTLEQIDPALNRKVGKIITRVGPKGLKELGKTRQVLRAEVFQSLKSGRVYVLDPNKKMPPPPPKDQANPEKDPDEKPLVEGKL
jgi:transposase